jgi:hypothetical protein
MWKQLFVSQHKEQKFLGKVVRDFSQFAKFNFKHEFVQMGKLILQ